MGIQLHTANTDLMLLHALSEPITGLSGYIVFEPVSYTHLDVYKRQTFSRSERL